METTIFFQRCTPEAGIKENLILEIVQWLGIQLVGVQTFSIFTEWDVLLLPHTSRTPGATKSPQVDVGVKNWCVGGREGIAKCSVHLRMKPIYL